MKVTVYYDYICPFCFIGTKRIQPLQKEFELDIEWKGIEIHPEFPPEGRKRSKTLKSDQAASNIKEMATEDRIQIKLPGFVTNSRLSLEAAEYAKTKHKFTQFHNYIYEAYFEHGENIGNREILLRIGERSGIQVEELEECLRQRTMRKKIDENKKDANENLILGVPTFVFGKLPIHGVQTMESLRRIIKRAIDKNG